jgi:hypothetical protein
MLLMFQSRDELVSGALESAFWAMDRLILKDKENFRISGGACALGNITDVKKF